VSKKIILNAIFLIVKFKSLFLLFHYTKTEHEKCMKRKWVFSVLCTILGTRPYYSERREAKMEEMEVSVY
jgi:hypothetical protein